MPFNTQKKEKSNPHFKGYEPLFFAKFGNPATHKQIPELWIVNREKRIRACRRRAHNS